MATIDVVNLGGEKLGSLELADEVFGAMNEDLLWEAVKHYRAGQRAGTHATKNKKLVSGAGRKLWRQKGTGARAWAPFARRCGGTAARSTDRSRVPRLRLPAQEAAGSAALGAGGEAGRRQTSGGGELRHRGTQNQSLSPGPGQAEREEYGAAGGEFGEREPQPAPELAQPGGCGADGGQSRSMLSTCCATRRNLRASRAGEVAGCAEGSAPKRKHAEVA